MSRLHGYEGAPGCRADLAARAKLGLHDRAIVAHLDRTSDELDRATCRGRPKQFHRVLRCHGARRRGRARAAHEVISRGPVGVAIEQRSRDTAGERPLESLVVLLRVPDRDDLVAARQSALYAQTLLIARAAPEAR